MELHKGVFKELSTLEMESDNGLDDSICDSIQEECDKIPPIDRVRYLSDISINALKLLAFYLVDSYYGKPTIPRDIYLKLDKDMDIDSYYQDMMEDDITIHKKELLSRGVDWDYKTWDIEQFSKYLNYICGDILFIENFNGPEYEELDMFFRFSDTGAHDYIFKIFKDFINKGDIQ